MAPKPSKCTNCGAVGRPYYVVARLTDDTITYDLRKICDRCIRNILDQLDRDNAQRAMEAASE